MKIFEKTWANRNKNQGGFGMKWLAKEFWRAALEYIRDNGTCNQQGRCGDEVLIEQELEE